MSLLFAVGFTNLSKNKKKLLEVFLARLFKLINLQNILSIYHSFLNICNLVLCNILHQIILSLQLHCKLFIIFL